MSLEPPKGLRAPSRLSAKYRAPALEKGLDVLELLAAARKPLTLSQISSRLDRSVSELFRMVQVLEGRGYVAASARTDGYELTNRLFSLGIGRAPSQNLLTNALPLMQELANHTRQSCHLAIASDDNMAVIARIEAPGDLGFSVRVGLHRKIVKSTSGIILYAFQSDMIKSVWGAQLRQNISGEEWANFEAETRRAVTQGYIQTPSSSISVILDISCPVFNDLGLIAALTVPYISVNDSMSLADACQALKATAQTLSKQLGA